MFTTDYLEVYRVLLQISTSAVITQMRIHGCASPCLLAGFHTEGGALRSPVEFCQIIDFNDTQQSLTHKHIPISQLRMTAIT